jgi:hypothetical protein
MAQQINSEVMRQLLNLGHLCLRRSLLGAFITPSLSGHVQLNVAVIVTTELFTDKAIVTTTAGIAMDKYHYKGVVTATQLVTDVNFSLHYDISDLDKFIDQASSLSFNLLCFQISSLRSGLFHTYILTESWIRWFDRKEASPSRSDNMKFQIFLTIIASSPGFALPGILGLPRDGNDGCGAQCQAIKGGLGLGISSPTCAGLTGDYCANNCEW